MNRKFDYKGMSRWLLCFGVILSVIGPIFGWLVLVGAGARFVLAIFFHVDHVGQQLAIESLEIRKRIKSLEDRIDGDADSDE